ncbi:hypothetical protein [Salinimicrobium sediminilitoris]|uniref:hypothetical protein n=1 Tax=Salinimicrobium sediminilitoris TaxID=2876715 RepID=UPI001E2C9204|nr:hypothetical protein [Salinimicrobium sediminilitoris]MCC8360613.1 hypothetical protein [Salinimicrobium sediminilitoris]
MNTYWNIPEIPHKGWNLEYVYDIREEGESVDETDYETCMMCNNERIRFVHVVSHKAFSQELKVGCVCAEKMTSDYVNPKKQEQRLRHKAQRRINWLRKEWKASKNGNLFVKVKDHLVVIFRDKRTKKFRCKIGEFYGKKQFETIKLAKLAAFEGIEYFKKKDMW